MALNTIVAPLCEGMADKADIVDWMQAHPQDISRIYDIALAGEAIRPSGGARQYTNIADMKPKLDSNWIIRDLIPSEGMGALYGASGSGKTFWTVDVGLSIACGQGYKNQLTKHGGVVYYALEGGALFFNRCIKWTQLNQIDFGNGIMPFEATTDPLDLLVKGTESQVDGIIADIRQFEEQWGQPIKMVVVDTLNRAMAGGNENSSEDMGALVRNCDRIWQELGCFLLIVHHTGKEDAKGLRGHSSLKAAINTEIQITNLQGTDFKQAEVLKQRDGEQGQTHMFNLQSEKMGIDSDGLPVTTCIINHADGSEIVEATKASDIAARGLPRGKNQKVLWSKVQALMEIDGKMLQPGDGQPQYQCIPKAAVEKALSDALNKDGGHSKSAVGDTIDGLIGSGWINEINDYIWITEKVHRNG